MDQLSLAAFYNDYQVEKGQPPYSPNMMVKILMYALSKGIMSSRNIERACYEDVGMRFLSGILQPDH